MGGLKHLRGKRVYFDANIFIYLLEGHREFWSQIFIIEQLLLNGHMEVVTSDLTYTEILPLPARMGDERAMQRIVTYLSAFETLPITREITIHAGILRGETGMKSPDALHVAAALHGQCQTLITNDAGLKTPKQLDKVLFRELA